MPGFMFAAVASRGIRRRSTTLAADGTDQSAALIALIAATPDGGTIYLDPGRYRIDQTINIVARTGLRLIGRYPSNPTVFYTDQTGVDLGDIDGNGRGVRQHFHLSASHNCTLRNIHIEGPLTERDAGDPRFALYGEAWAFEHGVSIVSGCSGIVVDNVTFENVGGDGIYVGGTGTTNTDITIRNITGTHCGRQSLGIVNVDGCLIEDVDIQWGGRSGLDIEPNHDNHYVRNFTIRRATIGSKFYPFIVGGDWGDSNPHVSDIVLEDCIGVNASSSHPAILASSHKVNLTIRRHTDLRQRSTAGISIGNTTGTIIVEDCVVTSGQSTPTSYGVTLNNCPAAVYITGCTFQGVGGTPPWGADELYLVVGTAPLTITHYGNVWQAPIAENDGPPP